MAGRDDQATSSRSCRWTRAEVGLSRPPGRFYDRKQDTRAGAAKARPLHKLQAARLAGLVPGERVVHTLRRGRRWEFAGSGRGEGLEEVADQPVGALGCVFGSGGDDPGVGHQQQWDVFGHEVLSEAPGGLGPLDQLRDSVVDVVPLRPEFAGVGEGLGQDVAESAITLLHAGDGGEVVAEASPRIRLIQSALDRFGVGGELGAEGGDQQVLPSRKAAVQGGDADSGPAGYFFGGSVQPLVGEDLPRGLQEQLPVAFGISAQLLTTAVAAVVPLHVTDPTIKWNDSSRSCTLEMDRLVHLYNTIGRSITIDHRTGRTHENHGEGVRHAERPTQEGEDTDHESHHPGRLRLFPWPAPGPPGPYAGRQRCARTR